MPGSFLSSCLLILSLSYEYLTILDTVTSFLQKRRRFLTKVNNPAMTGNTRERSSLWAPIAVEVALSLLGFWTLWAFPYNNGLLGILKSQTEPGALIPGPTAAPMKQTYTGIPPFDNQLTTLVSFFYTAIDGNRGDVSLAFLGLGGAVLAAWSLVTVESYRSGNQGKWLITS